MQAALSAKDIAGKIQRPSEPLENAVSRLKNWTKEGLIKPDGEKNPGTGVRRRYSQEALLDAVLLQTLIDATGMPAVEAARILPQLREHVVPASGRPSNISVVVISRASGTTGFYISGVKTSHFAQWLTDSNEDCHTVIHARKLFDRLGI